MTSEKISRQYVNLSKIKSNPNNPRIIKDDAFKKLVQSLKDFPEMIEAREIVVNKDMMILGGNMRYRAAKEAGLTIIPVKIVDWSDEKQREFVIKDNVSGGDWDYDLLANEWDGEQLDVWGLDLPVMLNNVDITEDTPPPVEDDSPAVSEAGKAYRLGRHILYCGSFTDMDRFFESPAVACVTDPPYGIGYIGGAHRRRKKIANDKMSDDDFRKFLDDVASSISRNVSGGVLAFMSPLKLDDFRVSLELAGLTWRSYIIWVKNRFTLGGSDFQHQFEPILYHVSDGKYDAESGDESAAEMAIYGDINDRRAWNGGRSQSDVWFFANPSKSKDHPTMKPVGLMAKAILSISKAKDVIYEPFAGSGSTLIACEQTDRICVASELEPAYVDVVRKRWHKIITGSEEGWEEATPEIEL